jgi:hypothetical protein
LIGTIPEATRRQAGFRSPLERLLHALNQPLTGLQCAMEVALAGPRTTEQYVQGLRDGLELTERMRALVGAIREVVDEALEQRKEQEQEKNHEKHQDANCDAETADLKALLRQVLEDLKPVAEAAGIRVTLDCSGASSLALATGQRRLCTVAFRCVESILSLADAGSELRIDAGEAPPESMPREPLREAAHEETCEEMKQSWIRLRWYAAAPRTEFSRAELGLLVAQAGWERTGAKWKRERSQNLETVTLRLPLSLADA